MSATTEADAGARPVREALVLGNGIPPSPGLLRRLMASRPLLICADGGANAAAASGFTPDYVVGDLDSIAAGVRSAVPRERLIQIDADNTGTDAQKALQHAVKLGIARATLAGVTGGRTDHTLWNLSLLRLFADRLALRIVDDWCEIRRVQGCVRFCAPRGQKISLSALAGPATGVWTQGLRFRLCRETLALGVRDGISNEVVANPVEIGVEGGDLLLIVHQEGGASRVCWLSDQAERAPWPGQRQG